jgi:hypothetical protein
MQGSVLEREYGRAIAKTLRGLHQLGAPVPIFRSPQAADGLIQFPSEIAFGGGARFGRSFIHAGLQRVAVLLFQVGSLRQAKLQRVAMLLFQAISQTGQPFLEYLLDFLRSTYKQGLLNAVNMQLPGRGYLFPGQVASVCEKRFCPIVHMTDLPIIVSDEMPGNFSTFG